MEDQDREIARLKQELSTVMTDAAIESLPVNPGRRCDRKRPT
jgi:hypothetical protein